MNNTFDKHDFITTKYVITMYDKQFVVTYYVATNNDVSCEISKYTFDNIDDVIEYIKNAKHKCI